MQNGTHQPPPFFSVAITGPNQIGYQTNITNPLGVLALLGDGIRAYVQNETQRANQPKLAIANEIPRMNGPLRQEGAD